MPKHHYNPNFILRRFADNSVEDFYTEIKTRAVPVIDTIVAIANADLLPPISQIDKEHLVRFLWAQHLRSPFERITTLQDGTARRAMDEAILDTCRELAIPPSLIHDFLTKDFEQMMNDAVVKAPPRPTNPTAPLPTCAACPWIS